MKRYPAFGLANIEEDAIDALLRTRAGVQIIRKEFMHIWLAIMYDNLLTIKMGMPEGGRQKNNRFWIEAGMNLVNIDESLKVCQCAGKECRICWSNKQRVVAILCTSGHKGHHDKLLGFQPFKGGLSQIFKACTINI